MSRAVALVGALLITAAAACSAADDVAVRRTEPATTAPPETEPTVAETLGAEDLLARTRESIAFVTTPVSQGSGVLVEGGYVVTNAHVVDPHAEAFVSFEGRSVPRRAEVIGIDPFADIAVLGPLDVDLEPLALADDVDVAQGEDVFLIGFPGETDLEPEVTIASGLVSRLREYEAFDQTYVQTDAAIGGGQSGGALIDAGGRVIGISGYSFAEEFALALSGPDVSDAVDAVIAGATPDYHPIVPEPAVTSGAVSVADELDVVFVVVPASSDERPMTLTVPEDSEPTVLVTNLYGDRAEANQRLLDQQQAADPSVDVTDFADPLPSSAPGVYDLVLAAGDDVVIVLGTTRIDGAEVAFESSVPVVVYADPDGDQPITPGEPQRGVIDFFEHTDAYTLELEAGDQVAVAVYAGAGDAVLGVVAPGGSSADEVFFDDSGAGLYGYDVEEAFTAETTGTYRLNVGVNDVVVVGYEIAVERL